MNENQFQILVFAFIIWVIMLECRLWAIYFKFKKLGTERK